MTWLGLEPGPLDPESNTLTISQLRLPRVGIVLLCISYISRVARRLCFCFVLFVCLFVCFVVVLFFFFPDKLSIQSCENAAHYLGSLIPSRHLEQFCIRFQALMRYYAVPGESKRNISRIDTLQKYRL